MSPEPAGGRALRLLAPAKINLAFEVLARRDDGYHEIESVLTTLDLADELHIAPADGLELTLGGPRAGGLDFDAGVDGELCARAARALAEAAGRAPDAHITLDKRVPVAAGLGGGSSDAAAVLRGLNALWGLGWPDGRLGEVAASLGSDVPFFLHGGTARCSGRGEQVEPLRDVGRLRLLLVLPPLPAQPAKTTRRYAALRAPDFSDGHRVRRLAQRIGRGAPPPARDLSNAFEAVVERTEPELVAHYAAYAAAGAPQLHLCGAGPALYLLLPENAQPSALRRDLERAGAEVIEARTLPRADALAIAADA